MSEDVLSADIGPTNIGPANVGKSRNRVSATEIALAVGGFGIGTGEFAIMGLLPQVADDVAVSVPAAGAVISAYALGVVVGAPLIAVLAARFARFHVLLVLMAVFALGNFASAVAPSFHPLVAARFFAGLPHGAYFGVAALVAAGLAAPNQRARAVGRVMMGLTIATLFGTPLVAWFGQALGWRSAFAIVGGISLMTMVLIWLHVPRGQGRSAGDAAAGTERAGEPPGLVAARYLCDRLRRNVRRLHLYRTGADPGRGRFRRQCARHAVGLRRRHDPRQYRGFAARRLVAHARHRHRARLQRLSPTSSSISP
jgi:MFS family permease